MATSGRGSSSRRGGRKKQDRMKEMERRDAIRTEIILWVVVAVALLLFISNFGVGGTIGRAVSGFLFGVFGLMEYVVPVFLIVGSFFVASNRGNSQAVIKIIAAVIFVLFFCMLISLIVNGKDTLKPIEAFKQCMKNRGGGGILGCMLAYAIVAGFGLIGAYIVGIVAIIIAVLLFTGRSLMKLIKSGGQKAYDSAVESSEERREYREYRSKEWEQRREEKEEKERQRRESQEELEQKRREEREARRLERKVSGVSADTEIKRPKAGASDDMEEIHEGDELAAPETEKPEEAAPVENVEEAADEEPRILFGGETRSTAAKTAAAAQPQTDAHEEKGPELPPLSEHKVVSVEPVITGTYSDEPEEPTDVGDPEIESLLASTVQDIVTGGDAASSGDRMKELNQDLSSGRAAEAVAAPPVKPAPPKEYVFPTVDLLAKPKAVKGGSTKHQLMETADKLQEVLATFGVNVTVTDISCGPAVTRYEIQPEMGVKVSKIVGLADDIKLNLAAPDIRIEAPIPGKAAVGIEVPNKENVTVPFRELVDSEDFNKSKSKVSVALGKDIGGRIQIADIAKMPHVLIAGATGSGKSVCINTIIMSILYKATPDEVKLIMIDPKVVELSVYNGIPHLLIPVVTDPKKASGALNWAVAEMTERYEKFAEANVREITGYNEKIASIDVPEGQQRPKPMEQIVIIVDELADLMMVASGEVEEAICRLAQLARAAGIHLIIATQRPSVNVITGLIKANMPSRIAFAVTSGIDSRTILDMNGAEKLLGKGDMLYYPQGIPKPIRVQGAFVSDKEVSDVVAFIKEKNGATVYSEAIQQKVESAQSAATVVSIMDADDDDDGRDAYFSEAAHVIVDKEKASIGMLQRYLKIGFNRAARIMDQLEEAGVVGPEEGTKPRKVTMTPEELEEFLAQNE